MDPTMVFCDNPSCASRGKLGEGNIKVHSHREQRFRCTTCGQTFAAPKGAPFYRLHKDRSLWVIVVTLLTHGCPPQAIVAAYGLDERTSAAWHTQSGSHCQAIHDHHLDTKPLDLHHVQADELYAKRVGGRSWMALAMSVSHRLWLGGVVSPLRNHDLIQRLVNMVRRAWRPGQALLICVDGLASYVTAFDRAFREKVVTGRRGRPPYRLPGCVWLAQVIKSYSGRRLKDVCRRVVWGRAEEVEQHLKRTNTGRQINTSDIERLNATFRACLATLTRRGRALAHREGTLEKGMDLVGCVSNSCATHRSLRVRQEQGKMWHQRTPAMAAGWTDHVWSIEYGCRLDRPCLVHRRLALFQATSPFSRLIAVLPAGVQTWTNLPPLPEEKRAGGVRLASQWRQGLGSKKNRPGSNLGNTLRCKA